MQKAGTLVAACAALLMTLAVAGCGDSGGIPGGGGPGTPPPAPPPPPPPPVACGAGNPIGGINVVPSAIRTTGIAPFAVFFDATGTTATATTLPYHELQYHWDFGDTAAGNWAFGTRAGTTTNFASGPLAAHVYTQPGTYTVCLEVTDGTSIASQGFNVTVLSPDTLSTLCVSPVGNFGTCPPGTTTQLTSDDFDAAINTTAGNGATYKRIVFECGRTYLSSAEARIRSNGPGLIGTHPAGCANRPVINGGSHHKVVIGDNTPANYTLADWRIVGLDFDGVHGNGLGFNSTGIVAAGPASQITVYDNIFRRLHLGMNLQLLALEQINTGGPLVPIWHQWAVVGNRFTDNDEYAGIVTFNASAWIGNLVSGQDESHAFRLEHGSKIVVSSNDMTGTSSGGALTMRGWSYYFSERPAGTAWSVNTLPDQTYTEQSVVTDNILRGSGTGLPFTYSTANNQRPWFRDHLIERNLIITNTAGAAFTTLAGRATIRNNIIDMRAATGSPLRAIEVQKTQSPDTAYYVYNNSAYSAFAATQFGGPQFSVVVANNPPQFSAQSNPVNLVARNNLGWAPNNLYNGTVTADDLSGTATLTQTGNSSAAQVKQATSPFTNSALSQTLHWTPVDYAANPVVGPVPPVWSDFFIAPRPGNFMGAINP